MNLKNDCQTEKAPKHEAISLHVKGQLYKHIMNLLKILGSCDTQSMEEYSVGGST